MHQSILCMHENKQTIFATSTKDSAFYWWRIGPVNQPTQMVPLYCTFILLSPKNSPAAKIWWAKCPVQIKEQFQASSVALLSSNMSCATCPCRCTARHKRLSRGCGHVKTWTKNLSESVTTDSLRFLVQVLERLHLRGCQSISLLH